MILQLQKYLLLHGSIVLLVGIITGVIYWIVIITHKKHEIVGLWRVTHIVLITDGLMMIVSALLMPFLKCGIELKYVMIISLIISGYGFTFAFITGAFVGIRGPLPLPWGINTILFIGHLFGTTGSFIGAAVIVYGLLVSV